MAEAPTQEMSRNRADCAAERLLPLSYDELRSLAAGMFRNQPRDHPLQPTALVHEAYVRLANQRRAKWKDRAHFIAVAVRIMRHLLVDQARSGKAGKRGRGWRRVTLAHVDDALVDSAAERSIDLLALEEALQELARLQQRQARVVQLRFFAGLTIQETASVLGASTGTVDHDWSSAREWLMRRLATE